MNRHQFEQAAKHFRAGRLTLSDFSAKVFPEQASKSSTESNEQSPIRTEATLPTHADDAHKGNFGRVLAIGGSPGMSGAIALTGLAALRSGSGLVVVATQTPLVPVVAGFSPCYMTVGLDPYQPIGKELDEKVAWADVIALGPGIGQATEFLELVEQLYSMAPQPMVVDADALNGLADRNVDLANHRGPRILTPHPGEFRRLTQVATGNRQTMEEAAIALARQSNVTIVLKGHKTLVTNGTDAAHNATGNSGMATAGSGDVLTGMIASLIGQGLSEFEAAKSACWIHGTAGDLAAKQFGPMSLISSDLIDFLPAAFKSVK